MNESRLDSSHRGSMGVGKRRALGEKKRVSDGLFVCTEGGGGGRRAKARSESRSRSRSGIGDKGNEEQSRLVRDQGK